MGVEKFLDASTGHITYEDSNKLLNFPEVFPSRVIVHEYGWLINVMEGNLLEDEMIKPMRKDGYSESFISLIRKASEHNCWWINLDCDGGYVEDLRSHEW